MYCPDCGFLLSPDQQFCPNCGKYIPRVESTPSVINSNSSGSYKTTPSETIINNWRGLLIFFSVGWLLTVVDFLPRVWVWYFDFNINTLLIRLGFICFWSISTVLAIVLSKFSSNKIKMLVGYVLILIGLAAEFFSPSILIALLGLLPTFAGVICLLSSLPKTGHIHPWIYPVGGIVGALTINFLINPLYERLGFRMVPLLTFGFLLIIMIVLIFISSKEAQTGNIFPKSQSLFIIGAIGGIFVLLILLDILFSLIHGIPLF